jgi:hypothetical protein
MAAGDHTSVVAPFQAVLRHHQAPLATFTGELTEVSGH